MFTLASNVRPDLLSILFAERKYTRHRALISKSMSWSLLRMSRYVAQSKYLDQLKQNDELCSKAFDNASFLMFSQGKPFLKKAEKGNARLDISWSTLKEVEPLSDGVRNNSVLLGMDENAEENVALFGVPVKNEFDASAGKDGRFSDMRRAIMTLNAKQAGIVSRGYSLLNWHATALFCTSCASPMTRNISGTMRSCSKSCEHGKSVYPTTHPVAITRVIDSTGEKILLGRQARHPPGMYSCVAGFMETGEAVEETVRREVAEEVGVVIENIKYFDSQTWPLPQNTLMLAFTATAMAGSEKIEIDKSELEDARWFSKDEIKVAYERVKQDPMLFMKRDDTDLKIPPRGAIAYYLIKDWLKL